MTASKIRTPPHGAPAFKPVNVEFLLNLMRSSPGLRNIWLQLAEGYSPIPQSHFVCVTKTDAREMIGSWRGLEIGDQFGVMYVGPDLYVIIYPPNS